MRALRFARTLRFSIVAALISVSVVESSDAFARAAGGAGGAAGAGSGGAGGGGGAGAFTSQLSVINPIRGPIPRFVRPAVRHSGSCYKEEYLYDRFGDAVVNLHGSECFGG